MRKDTKFFFKEKTKRSPIDHVHSSLLNVITVLFPSRGFSCMKKGDKRREVRGEREDVLHTDVMREVAIELERELRAVLRPLRLGPLRACGEGGGSGVAEDDMHYLTAGVRT